MLDFYLKAALETSRLIFRQICNLKPIRSFKNHRFYVSPDLQDSQTAKHPQFLRIIFSLFYTP